MMTIPLTAGVPNQTVTTTLEGIGVQINVYQKSTGLFMDLYLLPGSLVLGGILCRDRAACVLNSYLGFPGDLTWVDMEGTQDPDYTGVGKRFQLISMTLAEIPAMAIY